MAADGLREQAFVTQPVKSSTLPVAGGDGEHRGQVARGAGDKEAVFQRQRQFLGESLTHEALDHHGITVPDEPHRLGCGHHFVAQRGSAEEFGGQRPSRGGGDVLDRGAGWRFDDDRHGIPPELERPRACVACRTHEGEITKRRHRMTFGRDRGDSPPGA